MGSQRFSRTYEAYSVEVFPDEPSRLSRGQESLGATGPLPLLHDLDQPFIFNISMYNRPYRFEFFDTASPENYTLLRPDFIIFCYDVTDRRSLSNIPEVWRKDVARHYTRVDEDVPLMVLGLKRDARVEEEGVIYPQEVSVTAMLNAAEAWD